MSERFPSTSYPDTDPIEITLGGSQPIPEASPEGVLVVDSGGLQNSEAINAMEKYREEQVASWLDRLNGEVAPETQEEVTAEIESAIAREVSLTDDPNSPRRWFGERILSNSNKSRHGASVELGRGYETTSRRYAAELAVDILMGRFDTRRADEIVLNNNRIGGVEIGQHRVAALAMIYGSNWQEKAKEDGHKIILDVRLP